MLYTNHTIRGEYTYIQLMSYENGDPKNHLSKQTFI